MKITGVQAIALAIPLLPLDPPSSWSAGTRKQIIVRVHTDEGLTGTGEAFIQEANDFGYPVRTRIRCHSLTRNYQW